MSETTNAIYSLIKHAGQELVRMPASEFADGKEVTVLFLGQPTQLVVTDPIPDPTTNGYVLAEGIAPRYASAAKAAKRPATPKQVNYAARLISRLGWQEIHDVFDGRRPSRADLAAMSSGDISALISEIR